MRNLFSKLGMLAVLALSAVALSASAQTYPFQNPTYIPNAILAPVTLSAPGDIVFTTNGVGLVSTRVSGTCTALAAVLQGSNDGTNYTALNAYPVATGASAPVAVASVSAAGFWKSNVEGMTTFRVHVTALTASCTFALVGKPGGFNGANF
jgi:hypothetical protein